MTYLDPDNPAHPPNRNAVDREAMDDETLGPCGCIDYHMADCPTRTGGSGMDSATIYAMTSEQFDDYMDRDDY